MFVEDSVISSFQTKIKALLCLAAASCLIPTAALGDVRYPVTIRAQAPHFPEQASIRRLPDDANREQLIETYRMFRPEHRQVFLSLRIPSWWLITPRAQPTGGYRLRVDFDGETASACLDPPRGPVTMAFATPTYFVALPRHVEHIDWQHICPPREDPSESDRTEAGSGFKGSVVPWSIEQPGMTLAPVGPPQEDRHVPATGSNDLASVWQTDEYKKQGGLELIKASSMYPKGGTGKGVTVGLIDSGATPDHPDLKPKYDVVDGFEGVEPIDTHGHGTHVAGIIAARKDNTEMHGVAHEARLASYALEFDENDDVDDFELAKATDELREFGIRIVNNSWGKIDVNNDYISITIADVDRQEVDNYFPYGLPAYRRYLEADGVQVWAAGNSDLAQPSFHAGLPHLVPELERGWLAVVSLGQDGDLAFYSQQCGVAAAWCIAAPGGDFREDNGIYSTVPGGYAPSQGTSMAAPQVSGALAGLKSMFPNLGFQDVRDRILFTANKTGIYADSSVYGQGLLDLEAASRPIGGTLFPLGGYDDGSVATTQGAWLLLPESAVSRHLYDETILVLDRYQRAPFFVPISRYIDAGAGELSIQDLELITPKRISAGEGQESVLSIIGQDFHVSGMTSSSWLLGAGRGAGLSEGLAGLAGIPLPHGNFRMDREAVGMSLGYRSEAGTVHGSVVRNPEDVDGSGLGIMGWNPRSVLAVSFVGAQANYALGAAFASDLTRPFGIEGTGPFAVSGDSIDLGFSRTLFGGDALRLVVESRLSHFAPNEEALVGLDNALLATGELDISIRLNHKTTLNARLSLEHPVYSSDTRIRVARSIDHNGRIDYADIMTIDQADLLQFNRVGASMNYHPRSDSTYSVGMAAVQDGFERTHVITGAWAEFRS